MYKIQTDFQGGKCYQITSYEYNNRFILNTQIKITANGVECKKQKPNPVPPTPKPVPPTPKPPVQKKRCKYKPMIPGDFIRKNEEGVMEFQKFCSRFKMWDKDLSDGTTVPCTSKDIDGKWGCCTQTCYEKYKKRKSYDEIPR